MATRAQSYASHRRWHVLFHFVGFPILFINAIVASVQAVRVPSLLAAWNVVVAIALVISIYLARSYALTVQNRVIRLEERIRLQRCLPEDLSARIHEIRTEHLIGLRFCSDEELADMVRAILAGEVRNRQDIKRRIRTWRSDLLRV